MNDYFITETLHYYNINKVVGYAISMNINPSPFRAIHFISRL